MTRSLGRTLERNVALPYVVVFVLVLAIFAVAVHAVVQVLHARALAARLDALAKTAAALAERDRGRFGVADGAGTVLGSGEGIEWFDASGRRLAARGTVASPSPALHSGGGVERPAESVASITRPVLDDGRTAGYVRASISDERSEQSVQWIDAGLIVGFVFAAATSAAGGWYLSRRSITQVAASVNALEEFTANAAHELRSPLAAVRANTEAALRDEHLTVKDRSRLETVVETAASMHRLIDDLLLLAAASGARDHEVHAVDLAELVQAVAADAADEAARRGVELELQIDGNPSTRGNALQITRIVANLVDNALRHSPPGEAVHLRAWSERGAALVSVRDRGPGIAPQNAARIFERFWRADPARGAGAGTGLGLAIVDALAKRHAATVAVTSTPGSGSTFTVTFPNPR
ncbi:MAG TPA: HAMP domain-containing sensor histidine kinase [Candidatus Elarobacter sp.]|jgi:OmpR-family two-component system manganese-sensing sensor histidine kinase